ncbi:MAG: hypothetical protein B6244_07895 [Candidatus Cloacimonetes bacterium 4572_55]|nr:MAG: hypothetical protein B6244_07895 [Candidatus Cloacimonetes bacterium 4572_55]
MELVELATSKRDSYKKGPARRMRAQGKIPGVIYGHDLESVPIVIDTKKLNWVLRHHIGRTYIIDVKIEGDAAVEDRWAIIRELQRDPVTDNLVHVDFYQIKRGEEISIGVPIHFVGSPIGVKSGGVLEVILRSIEVKCLPRDIPEFIEVRIDELNIGDAIHISDIDRKDFEMSLDERSIVAHVVEPRGIQEEKDTTDEDTEDGAEGETETEETSESK